MMRETKRSDGSNTSPINDPKVGIPPPMNDTQPGNPLHGVTLEALLVQLAADYGWPELGRCIDIACFNHEPSIKFSLKFLRKTPWARAKLEELYLRTR
jgi:uncharacterized protein (DUF2132 family)